MQSTRWDRQSENFYPYFLWLYSIKVSTSDCRSEDQGSIPYRAAYFKGCYTVDSSGLDCKSSVLDSGGATPSQPTSARQWSGLTQRSLKPRILGSNPSRVSLRGAQLSSFRSMQGASEPVEWQDDGSDSHMNDLADEPYNNIINSSTLRRVFGLNHPRRMRK